MIYFSAYCGQMTKEEQNEIIAELVDKLPDNKGLPIINDKTPANTFADLTEGLVTNPGEEVERLVRELD